MKDGLIPQAFIDELIQNTDIVELIDSYIPLKKRGMNYIACCPFHNEKTPSFNVTSKQQLYHCFGCHAGGNAISFVMNYLQQPFPTAIETLAARLGMQIPRNKQAIEQKESSNNLYELLQRVTRFYQHTLKHAGSDAILYLKKRGITGEIARQFQLGYAPSSWHALELQFKKEKNELIQTGMLIQREDGKTYDRYRGRIIFPIHDRHSRIIGFGGRSLDNTQQPKYLNSPETSIFQKSKELYGLYQVRQALKQIPYIIVVEGYMDVIALVQHGILNVVATLGTATTSYHIQLLAKYTQQLIFCFDGDQAGRDAAWRALDSCLSQIDTGLDINFIFLPEGQDPDDLIRQKGSAHFLELVKTARPLSTFFFDTLTHNADRHTLDGKNQIIQTAKPYLKKINEGAYKQLLLTELARLVRLDEHRLSLILQDKTSLSTSQKLEKKQTQITRSPLRVATAILLQHPEIYALCPEKNLFVTLHPEKHTMLLMLTQYLSHNPTVSTAVLLENWRDTPWFKVFHSLATWDHQIPQEILLTEFTGIILFLSKQNQEHEIQTLLNKAQQQNLTPEEREKLQNLLKQRHAPKTSQER